MNVHAQAATEPGGKEPASAAGDHEPILAVAGQPPAAAVAFRLAQKLASAKSDLIYIASSDRRAEQTARALRSFAPDLEVLYLPAWDCLPYDRASPAREVMGERMATLQRLLQPAVGRRIVMTSPEAALQRVPPMDAVREEWLHLEVGAPLDREALEAFATRTGYVVDDRVDEAGEIAFRGNVVDVFPADAEAPVRITEENGLIEAIDRFDPHSQRTTGDMQCFELRPASELIVEPDKREIGAEHRLAAAYGVLPTIFEHIPNAKLLLGEPVESRVTLLLAQIAEAYETAKSFSEEARPAPPSSLYLDEEAWVTALAGHKRWDIDLNGLDALPDFLSNPSPARAVTKFITQQLEAGNGVVLCRAAAAQKRLGTMLKRSRISAETFPGALAKLPGKAGVWLADFDLEAGFLDGSSRLTVIAAGEVLDGSAIAEQSASPGLTMSLDLRVGDIVVHEDHGVGVLEDLTRVEADGVEQDTIRLRYHGDATLMVPVQDFGKLWRYGAEADGVKLDRLNTDAWDKKRAEVSAEIDAAAGALAQLAAERLDAEAAVLKPPRAAYQRLAARFPYAETPDQAAAIAAVLDDLASGHPMNRLVCGDVGFGKTEIALRAAAAVALAGKQVAVVAPTTVLARQHLQSFERRFAGTDIAVGHLSRLNTPSESDAVKAQLRSGAIRVVIATHAIAADDVELPELGLVIIDEEQRFGAKLKRQLEELAQGVHLLSMSATPIPRTLQAAMVGLQDVSVMATPPARRLPVRTFVVPYDAAAVRTALLREKRRGGQSFFVVPRIEDIENVAAELGRIVPELSVGIAHGGLGPKQIDTALLQFANGAGDILLATNIVESGLDVPRANTILIWRADRFGLSQLHQLRGRVGRGRAQGIAYLLTDPDEEVSDATRNRLATLEAFDRLGSGFEIAARDLELRGAGDLMGEDQAGHVHLIGAGLYGQLLENALATAKGEMVAALLPAQLNLGLHGFFPTDYVPEAVVRINLYARLQRITRIEDLDAFAEELEDRFGECPAEVEVLLGATRLALLAGTLGVARIDAGPKAIALTLGKKADEKKLLKLSGNRLQANKDRLIAERDGSGDVLAEVQALLALS